LAKAADSGLVILSNPAVSRAPLLHGAVGRNFRAIETHPGIHLFLQVIRHLLNYHRVFDAGNQHHNTPACPAGFDVNKVN